MRPRKKAREIQTLASVTKRGKSKRLHPLESAGKATFAKGCKREKLPSAKLQFVWVKNLIGQKSQQLCCDWLEHVLKMVQEETNKKVITIRKPLLLLIIWEIWDAYTKVVPPNLFIVFLPSPLVTSVLEEC